MTGNKNIFSRLINREAGKSKAHVALYPKLDLFREFILKQPYDLEELFVTDMLLSKMRQQSITCNTYHSQVDLTDAQSNVTQKELNTFLENFDTPDKFDAFISLFQMSYSMGRLGAGQSDYQPPVRVIPSKFPTKIFTQADLQGLSPQVWFRNLEAAAVLEAAAPAVAAPSPLILSSGSAPAVAAAIAMPEAPAEESSDTPRRSERKRNRPDRFAS